MACVLSKYITNVITKYMWMKTKFAQVKSLLEPVESHSVIKEI